VKDDGKVKVVLEKKIPTFQSVWQVYCGVHYWNFYKLSKW